MRYFLILIMLSSYSFFRITEGNKVGTKLSIKKTHSHCVENIFYKDSILGEIRNHASEKISLSEAINNYTYGLNSLDYSDCPENFVAAFKKHIRAWKKVTKISDKYPLLRGELHDIFNELEKSKDSTEFKSVLKDVWDTWNDVMANSQ